MITDLSYLIKQVGADEEFIRSMIDIFKEQIEEYSTSMPKLVKDGNYLKLSKIAHKAKSSVAVMGMKAESDILQNLEIIANKEEDTELYEGIVKDILERLSAAIKELDKKYP